MSAVRRVLVVGGGIGGLTAAVALRRQGIEVDLVEQKADWRVYGVGIMQPNNALRALDKVGLAQPCVERGAGFSHWRMHDHTGSALFEVPISDAAAPGLPAVNGITRPSLQRTLVDAATAAGTSMRLGTTVCGIDDTEDLTVTFSDGSTGVYDLLVGADGAYSVTREYVTRSEARPRLVGESVWRYNFPRPAGMDGGWMYFGADTKVGLIPLSTTMIYMFLVTVESSTIDPAGGDLARLMQDRLTGYSGLVAELRDQIDDSSAVVYRPMESLLVADKWYRGRVILIGDAAHTTTPHLGQGAAMAVEDAVLLADLLARDATLESLLEEFMRRRFDRVRYVVESSEQIARWEIEQFGGIDNPDANPAGLLDQAYQSLIADY